MTDNDLLRLLAIQVTEMCDSVQRWLLEHDRIRHDLCEIHERLERLEKPQRGYTVGAVIRR